jgi:ribosome-binding factor A
MPKEFGRHQRVAQLIKEELSVFIQRDFPLNEYGMITLSNVDVSPDLSNATVYVTSFNNKNSHEELIKEMNGHTGQFRHKLSCIMTTRSVPSIRFKYDESIERAQRITDIINSVSNNDENESDG